MSHLAPHLKREPSFARNSRYVETASTVHWPEMKTSQEMAKTLNGA